ncbi:MAG: efflux RND transporter periplasmic adaptor subunit [Acidobacteria bacterium]|nr:efflux RND transporter periplasmic adaptor subunit [Acidobacteriota bacterium]
MAKRMVLMLVAMTLFLATIGFVKTRQIQAAIAQGQAYRPPPEAITTTIAKPEIWRKTLGAIGTTAAVQGVMVSADLPGLVDRIAFQSGRTVAAGDLLVHLDTRQEEAQAAAAIAKRDLARLSRDRIQGLRAKGVTSQSELDATEAEFRQAEASVGEIQATIQRKTIRAPFTGLLGIREVNLGQYLDSGQRIVQLQALDPIYVNFSVPQQDLALVPPGAEVRLTDDGQKDLSMTGKVFALASVVDEKTRNVQVQAVFANPSGRVRPGMFVRAEVALKAQDEVTPIPTSAIKYAPYGDSVFVVEEMKGPDGAAYKGLRQQFVKLGPSRGDQIAVLSGLKPGEEIATAGVFKLRNGVAVVVNNEVQPGNDPKPKPEDN